MTKKPMPKVAAPYTLGKLGIFTVESLDIEFSNGAERTYYRLASRNDAVTVLAIYQEQLVMVREFAAGTLKYQFGFVKGGMEQGETPEQAAIRELAEEASFKAGKATLLSSTFSSPSYGTGKHHIVLVEGLEPLAEPIPGDEPESLEISFWPVSQVSELFKQENFTDVYARLAVYELQAHLVKTKHS
ncbi:NUDIX domain-containing protein [Psittacicella hinzii]|uniref:Nudix hydrolase domain-containing protein n=1 Tax=Psittacicella hinzii TaxID=2028575 RepID=A0A3A1YQS8_9GAMM|nr:NUDIX domain-containing protein [Psittacicella hinzii]RIY39300.1 hypothetical protein CKF58_02345 [Psittacicella hinzii]